MFTAFNSSVTRTVVGTVGMTLCAGLCLVGATAPAHASPVYDTMRTRVVSYADLDLANAKGRATLALRIKSAARMVCETGGFDTEMKMAEASCIRRSIAAAELPKSFDTASR